MATLIAVYNSSGCVGRCDERCYDAIHPECTCICGGVNHGAGEAKARENTEQYCEEWTKRYKEEKGLDDSAISLTQLSLF